MGTKQFVQYQLAPEIYKIDEAVDQITTSISELESVVNAPKYVKPGTTEKNEIANNSTVPFGGTLYLGNFLAKKDGAYAFRLEVTNCISAGYFKFYLIGEGNSGTDEAGGTTELKNSDVMILPFAIAPFTVISIGDYYCGYEYEPLFQENGKFSNTNKVVSAYARMRAGDCASFVVSGGDGSGVKLTAHYDD